MSASRGHSRDSSWTEATIVVLFRKRAGLGKHNGELLNLAETAFDVLVTVDTNLRYQQNLAGRKWPSWFFSRPPTVSTIFANTFPPTFLQAKKMGLGTSFKLALP